MLLASATVVSCYKDDSYFDDTANITYNNQPVPAVFLNPLDSSGFIRGGRARMYLEYWAKDNVCDSVYIYATVGATPRTIVDRLTHKSAFSQFKQADTLIYFYNVAATATAGTSIKLDAEIVTKQGIRKATFNGSTSTRTFTVR
ncbi:MAG: hypothetical protein RL757_390 [Bacteroidota bacterium]